MENFNFEELIKAHKRAKNAEIKYKSLVEGAKKFMREKNISIWENARGSVFLKNTRRGFFQKELLAKAGINPKTFTIFKNVESFNVNHK